MGRKVPFRWPVRLEVQDKTVSEKLSEKSRTSLQPSPRRAVALALLTQGGLSVEATAAPPLLLRAAEAEQALVPFLFELLRPLGSSAYYDGCEDDYERH